MLQHQAAERVNHSQNVGFVAIQDHHGYDYLARCHFRKAFHHDQSSKFTVYKLSLTDLERHLPASLPLEVEMDAVKLPSTWLRLFLAVMRSIGQCTATSIHLIVFVPNVDGYLKRADRVEQCFDECEEVIESACFLRSGQQVTDMFANDREVSFDEVIRTAFAGVLTVGQTLDDGRISRCLSNWQWVSRKDETAQEGLYSAARL